MSIAKLCIATFLIAIFGFSLHVTYGQGWVSGLLNQAAQQGAFNDLIKPPYPVYITIIAAVTALIPSAFKVLAYYFAGHLLPFNSSVANGALFGLILVGFTGGLFRAPVMSFLVGNPGYIVLAQSAETWLIGIGSGILIALVIKPRGSSHAT